jgi:hypothetical protein
MKADFYSDWVTDLRQQLDSAGFSVPPTMTPDEVCVAYGNLQLREVPARPRTVYEADTLSIPTEHDAAFRALRQEIEVGTPLTPYLSRKLVKRKLEYNDLMLNAWGIQHLHFEKNGTKELLFAWLTDDDAYLIAVLDHDSWAKQSVLESVLRNWPQLLEPYRLKGFGAAENHLTDEEVANVRAKRGNTCITLSNGGLYASTGGGILASGTNFEVRRQVDICAAALRSAQQWLAENLDVLRQSASEHCRELPDVPRFRLDEIESVAGATIVHVVETKSRTAFETPPIRWR